MVMEHCEEHAEIKKVADEGKYAAADAKNICGSLRP
jgi:hypothetical protein